MAVQNYKNHIRFYPPHHFVFYPIMIVLLGFAIYNSVTDTINQKTWIFNSALIFVVGWLAFMLRQHYALVLQNRIIRGEIRYRYFAITGTRLEPMEHLLNDGQLFALRFAPDQELPHLIQKAIQEKMTPNTIKKEILNWLPDHQRV